MSLEMYAFSLDRSPAFPTPSSVLRYKVPKDGRLVGGAAGQAFLDSNAILPGSTLLQAWTDHPSLHEWMERDWNRARGFFKARTMGQEDRVVLKYPELSRLHFDVDGQRLRRTPDYYFGGPGVSDALRERDAANAIQDQEFVDKAQAAVATGKHVYYVARWF